jgi:hypothetical protein
MSSSLLADWTTVRGNANGTPAVYSIAQGSEDWVDLGDSVDATFWVDCREAQQPGGTGVVMLSLETAPSRDEASFVPVTGPITLTAGSSPLSLRSVASQVSSPLARWLRWRAWVPITATGTWDATFRIGMTGSPFSYFVPTQLGGCKLWLRADLGVTLTSAGLVSAWNDQSGIGNHFLQGNASFQPSYVAPPSGPTISFVPGANPKYLACTAGFSYSIPNSIFIAFKVSSITTATLVDGAGSNRQRINIPDVATSVQVYAGGTAQTVTGLSDFNLAGTLIEVDWNGASTTVWQNGVQQGSAVNPGSNAWGPGYLGADQTPGGNPFNGVIGEVVAYNRILSAVERTRLSRYFGRYGLVVP